MGIRAFFDILDAALVGSCDAGGCMDPTVAVILTDDMGWLSMCSRHALMDLTTRPTPEESPDAH